MRSCHSHIPWKEMSGMRDTLSLILTSSS
ncbi:MAG: hypothetical protein V2B20_18260 [Pseudomonadota bacterium]